jgi:hypothetical protein
MNARLTIDEFRPPTPGLALAHDQHSRDRLVELSGHPAAVVAQARLWQRELETSCRTYGWLSLTARLVELNAQPNDNGVDSTSMEGLLEGVALAALYGSSEDDAVPVRGVVPPAAAFQAQGLAISLVNAAGLIEVHRAGAGFGRGRPVDAGLFHLRLAQIHEGLMGRAPGHFLFPDVELLHALFDVHADLEVLWNEVTGCNPRTALRLSGYLSQRTAQILAEIREEARATAVALNRASREWAKKSGGQGLEVPVLPTNQAVHVPAGTPPEVLAELATAVAVASFANASALSLEDATETEEESGIPRGALGTYLKTFSQGLAELANLDTAARPLEARLALRRRPILRIGGRYALWPLANYVATGLRRRLDDDLMMASKAQRKRYLEIRTRFTEEKSTGLLARVTGADFVASSVSYELPGGGWAELDGLLVAGPYLYLLEVKGRDLRPSAQAGLPDQLVGDLKDIVRHATGQLERAYRCIVEENAGLRDGRHRPIVLPIRQDGVSAVFPVAVTYERLVGVAPTAWRLEDQGLLTRGGGWPWIVSLPELAVTADVLRPPFELPAFLIWRSAVMDFRVLDAIEEADLLMTFVGNRESWLIEKLHTHGRRGAPSLLADQTQDLSDYYGARAEGAPVPRKVPDGVAAELMKALAESKAPSRWRAASAVLALEQEERLELARVWRSVTRRRRLDRKRRTGSMVLGARQAVAIRRDGHLDAQHLVRQLVEIEGGQFGEASAVTVLVVDERGQILDAATYVPPGRE